jgi:hypothetical protein
LAISGSHISSLAARLKQLIMLMLYHFQADSSCVAKGPMFLMKLAQNLAQPRKVSKNRLAAMRRSVVYSQIVAGNQISSNFCPF